MTEGRITENKNNLINQEEADLRFEEYAKKLLSLCDGASFDSESKTVHLIVDVLQQNQSPIIEQRRKDNAEKVKKGDLAKLKFISSEWEVFSNEDESLGEIRSQFNDLTVPIIYDIDISNVTIDDLLPLSKSRKRTKYAKIKVSFDISPRRDYYNLTEKDLEIRKNYIYSIMDDQVELWHWTGGSNVPKIEIPSCVEGKPVVRLYSGLFAEIRHYSETDYKYINMGIEKWHSSVEEVVISEGIKRIDTGALFYVLNAKKIVFPSTIEYADSEMFYEDKYDPYENKEIKDYIFNDDTLYFAPKGSYIDRLLKDIRINKRDSHLLNVVNLEEKDALEKAEVISALDADTYEEGVSVAIKSQLNKEIKDLTVAIPNEINDKPVVCVNLWSVPDDLQKLVIPENVRVIDKMNTCCKDNLIIDIDPENRTFLSDGNAIYSKDQKALLKLVTRSQTTYSVLENTEAIAKGAFENSYLESIVIPSSVKKVEENAFSFCRKLNTIIGIENVECLDTLAFSYHPDSIPFINNQDVVILGSHLVKSNDGTNDKIVIPDGITTICANAFGTRNSDIVQEVVLPNSLKIIGYGAFYSCKNLKRIYIPENVETIGIDAFSKNIEWIEVDPNNRSYSSLNGVLYTKGYSDMLYVPDPIKARIKTVTVSSNNQSNEVGNSETLEIASVTKSISDNCFRKQSNITEVVLPDSIERIGKYVFYECTSLSMIKMPKSLKSIGSCAFSRTKLKAVDIPEGVEFIGDEAFANTSIKSIHLPKTVKTIGWDICSGIEEIEIYDTIDPDAADPGELIDYINGKPNSLVGYIGIGEAHAMRDCAANHQWLNYTISVKSSETDEIKYKVWMGADEKQRGYYSFLASAWGHNASFAFKELDEYFPKIRGLENQLMIAKYRLEYKNELSEDDLEMYVSFAKEQVAGKSKKKVKLPPIIVNEDGRVEFDKGYTLQTLFVEMANYLNDYSEIFVHLEEDGTGVSTGVIYKNNQNAKKVISKDLQNIKVISANISKSRMNFVLRKGAFRD